MAKTGMGQIELGQTVVRRFQAINFKNGESWTKVGHQTADHLNKPFSISGSIISSILSFGSFFGSILVSIFCSSKEILHSASEMLLDGKLWEDSSNEDGTNEDVYILVEGPTRIGIAGFIFGGALNIIIDFLILYGKLILYD